MSNVGAIVSKSDAKLCAVIKETPIGRWLLKPVYLRTLVLAEAPASNSDFAHESVARRSRETIFPPSPNVFLLPHWCRNLEF
ncbi:hypothetical protein AVEN_120805-1 [Araneus ventricosus]|uniref:Uncharacterized protein n=1 Tax=Araneus ventricosus TaxID=182803 RepID=A0A4Y2FA85_ARAVE|nr:hypothetical protein AVEN_120805-1 [Araneus ventricosus]